MTIYGRAGDVVTLKRLADEGDVLQLEGREPDQRDLAALRSLSYFVVEQDDGTEALHHIAYLRATGGAREIDAIVDDLVLAALGCAGDPAARTVRKRMGWALTVFVDARIPIIRDALSPTNRASFEKMTYEQKAEVVTRMVARGVIV